MKNYDLETICATVVNVPCWNQNFQHFSCEVITFSMCCHGNEFQFVLQVPPPSLSNFFYFQAVSVLVINYIYYV